VQLTRLLGLEVNLKVGVVGLGVMGKNHVRVLSTMDAVTEVRVFDPYMPKGEKFLGLEIFADLEQFLENDLDYCVVSSPTSTHESMAVHLAARGVPALVEKPISPTSQEGKNIIEVFSKAGLVGGVGHIERYNPATLAMKEKLEEGLLGKIYQITTRRVGPYTGRIRDVGVIKDLATHDIHLVLWLIGSSYGRLDARTISISDGPHEDSLIAVGSLDNGVLFSHVVNWISPTKERVTTILGERGLLVADTLNGNLFFHENGTNQNNWDSLAQFKGISEGPVHKFELMKIEPLVAEHLAFQNAIRTKNLSEIVTFESALEVLSVAEDLIYSGASEKD
jgi:UDP-N-acetylglucosamine 3-dehydrogenase